ncbi:YihY/virulence factor BrkB family protein [Undibacterium arcticum]|uniref:YihY/virulence factor BrkB family protein n=2 Tax=Undibacterium arcticum TaxID=1762892 RepID=A0ABV7F1E5_9BURK
MRRMRIVFVCAVEEWIKHRAASKGAALAFYTLFSMAPILVLVIAIAGFFYGRQAAQGELFAQLQGLIGGQGAAAIQLVLAGAHNPEEGRFATIIATVLLLIGATSVFAELKASLDDMWELAGQEKSGWWSMIRTRLLSFGLVLVLAFLLLVSLVVSAALAILGRFWGGFWADADVSLLLSVLSWLIGFIVIACMFGVIYKMLPQIHLRWRDVAIGAFGTAILFSLGKYGIGVYIGNSGVVNSFGAAGSLVALLLWVYYSALIFFFGAEFTRQYALQYGSLSLHDPGHLENRGAPATAAD